MPITSGMLITYVRTLVLFSVPNVPSVPYVPIMPVVLIVFMLLVVQMATRYKKYRIAGDIAYV